MSDDPHKSLPFPSVRTIVCGPSETGKSTVVYNIITKDWGYNEKFDDLFIVSPTAYMESNPLSQLKIPRSHVSTEYDSMFIEDILLRQENAKPSKRKKVLLILDDITGETGVRSSGNSKTPGILARIASRGRHFNIHFIAILHSVKTVDPDVRKNLTNVISFFYFEEAEQKAVHGLGGMGSFKEWRKLYAYCCGYSDGEKRDRYSFYNINLKSGSSKEMVFKKFTPVDVSRLMMGDWTSKDQHQASSSHHEKEEESQKA